jgi:hypothetical protein
MAEAQLIQTESMSHNRNQSRINKDEAELAALMKQLNGEVDEAQEDTESESSSEEFVEPKVQTASDTEQKEERKAEASQEDDDAELSSEERNFKKRYGDLRRHIQEKEQEWKLKFEKLEMQLDKAAKNELVLPKTEADIEAWAAKYPDVAGIVEAIADRKAQERSSDIDKRLSEIEEMRLSAKRQKAEAELMQLHPDFEQLRQEDAFHDWAEEQPKWVQDALYENAEDAKAVGRVIDLYKADKGITTKSNKSFSSDKEAASSVRTKRNTTPNHDDTATYLSESQVNKMTMKEFEKRMDEIMEAQRTGRFIYDVSKK